MGDLVTLAKARQELEDLYLGVPDESVNLTFQDLAELTQQNGVTERKKPNIEQIPEVDVREGLSLGKSPSLDFSKALQASKAHQVYGINREGTHTSRGYNPRVEDHAIPNSSRRNLGLRNTIESSMAYDDVMSGISMTSRNPYCERGVIRRPGIPHSNICTICSTYIYIFRHRCLVCGRAYCRHCVGIGMGDMTEGRKCVECLGRRFSQRYIGRAGKIGCCTRYPSMVKQQELKWAEKGFRRSGGERGYGGRSGMMMSGSRSPIGSTTPTNRAHVSTGPPSFVMSSQYSAYSPANHPIPY